ncbi:hypothetical protein SNE40_023713 [Patella caerulea]|uniref:CCHC-type domain-containing protein n=1 Tax=Patella caerulea TaxID=87958 RepID=A0AAN8FZH4_PATCE
MARKYSKECTVKVNVTDLKNISIEDVIVAVENCIGEGLCLAAVPRYPNIVEVTVNSVENAQNLCDGINIDGQHFDVELMYSPYIIVSFLNIPSHIEDEEITNKLTFYNIEIVGEVVRHYYKKFPNVANGTRHVKCKFPPNVKSLPWAMNFDSADGPRGYKVLHNNQTKVCFKCLSCDHEKSSCPLITCRKCKQPGHMAYKCVNIRCEKCNNFEFNCKCEDNFYETNEEISTSSSESDIIEVDDKENKREHISSSTSSTTSEAQPIIKKQRTEAEPLDINNSINDIDTPDKTSPAESTRCDNLSDNEHDKNTIADYSIIDTPTDESNKNKEYYRRPILVRQPAIQSVLKSVNTRADKKNNAQ